MADKTKKYINKMSKKYIILAFLVVVIAGLIIGAFYFGKKQAEQSEADIPIEYFSFMGNYKFTLPDAHTVDGESVPGMVLISKTGTNLKIKKIAELYDQGGITVHLLLSAFDGNNDAFEKYINGNFKSQLVKDLGGEVEILFEKKGQNSVAIIKAIEDGKIIRFEKIVNFLSAPVALVAGDDSDEFEQIFTTLAEIDAADQDLKRIKNKVMSSITFAQNGLYEELYKMLGAEDQKKINKKDFIDSFEAAENNLKRDVYVSGGTLRGNVFSAMLRLNDPAGKDDPIFGLISIKKTSKGWELTGFQIPADESEEKTGE